MFTDMQLFIIIYSILNSFIVFNQSNDIRILNKRIRILEEMRDKDISRTYEYIFKTLSEIENQKKG